MDSLMGGISSEPWLVFCEASGSLCERMRQPIVNLIRCAVVKRRMSALFVVKANPAAQAVAKLGTTAERMQVKVVMFDGPPQTLNEDVVLTSAAAVHADADALVLENLSKTVAGKLGALIRVEDFRLAIAAQGLLEGLNTEIRFQCIGNTPR